MLRSLFENLSFSFPGAGFLPEVSFEVALVMGLLYLTSIQGECAQLAVSSMLGALTGDEDADLTFIVVSITRCRFLCLTLRARSPYRSIFPVNLRSCL